MREALQERMATVRGGRRSLEEEEEEAVLPESSNGIPSKFRKVGKSIGSASSNDLQ
jgi:hypothetical protein